MNEITLKLVDIDYEIIKKQRHSYILLSLSTSFCLIFQHFLPKKNFTWYDAIIVCLPPIVILIYYFIIKNKTNYKLNGTMSIVDSKIRISRNSSETVFVLKDIQQINIVYRAFDDSVLPEIKDQINAYWVEIVMEKEKYTLDYIIETKYELRLFIHYLKSLNNNENVRVFNLAKLVESGANKLSNKELRKEYLRLIDNKLKRLKTTSANIV